MTPATIIAGIKSGRLKEITLTQAERYSRNEQMLNQVINVEKALAEKKAMQKAFFDEHGYPSSVLTLLIAHFEQRKEK